jgi:hypothetical protein
MTIEPALALALLSCAFSAGLAVSTLRGKASKTALAKTHAIASQALRAARRAHERLDELEEQTGTRTALRGEDLDGGP